MGRKQREKAEKCPVVMRMGKATLFAKKGCRTRFPQGLHQILELCTRLSTFLAKKWWITGLLSSSSLCYTSPISIVLACLLALFPRVVLKQSLGRKAEP